MISETNREPEMGLTFEKVWAALQENARQMRESQREFDRLSKETDARMKETDAQIKETAARIKETAAQMKETDAQMKETDRKMKETDRKIGKLGDRLGELIEHLVAPNMIKKFNDLGYTFSKYSIHVIIDDPKLSLAAEIDILLENGDVALAVEVKSKLATEHISDHVARMQKLRRYSDARKDFRKFIGAVAGGIVPPEAKSFALKNGFYVMEQSGDTMTLDIPKDFSPKEW
ncbi:MAG: hypothetical protein LBQ57_11095 [Spirochaetales bacterium]|jgi:hypothetical protein|nr:hypothetical protein [Spirochaetales bacterium]